MQDALIGAMAVMSALVRGLMLQGGTGVAVQAGSASEKITNNALSLMMVSFSGFDMELKIVRKRAKHKEGYLNL